MDLFGVLSFVLFHFFFFLEMLGTDRLFEDPVSESGEHEAGI